MKQFNESYAVATPVFASIAIPPTPAILLAIREAHQQNASLVDIAQLISQDDSLVMAVLKAINSSFYCLRERICSIEQAIKLLGMRNISILIDIYSAPREDCLAYMLVPAGVPVTVCKYVPLEYVSI